MNILQAVAMGTSADSRVLIRTSSIRIIIAAKTIQLSELLYVDCMFTVPVVSLPIERKYRNMAPKDHLLPKSSTSGSSFLGKDDITSSNVTQKIENEATYLT